MTGFGNWYKDEAALPILFLMNNQSPGSHKVASEIPINRYMMEQLFRRKEDQKMYYAIIDARGDCDSMAGVLYGETLNELASEIVKQCQDILDIFINYDGMTMDDIQRNWNCDFDSYYRLSSKDKLSISDIENFIFTLSDQTLRIFSVALSYDVLAKQFDLFVDDKVTLSIWMIAPGYEGTKDQIKDLDDELKSICADFGYERGKLKYFMKRPE